ncbi:dTDP-4-dehydrorhamnose reductase [Asticcacaulis machinosus]|uniref:dTDP-4-dehydrorhamnose reductase n=1 Tax=Asticcacaulis machinosus TaxID=2984211 RepID=A0ABT5HKJ1_9CAUL|nr:dTDP-4-dehydrorhamnose reductase [Asticcacaulis machinosus]MDC7676508.1 dTDP-4-dehydrorhamnose reductase [Asticcacaulis machinosus]
MRILVTGKKGQVATALKVIGAETGVEILTFGRPEGDLANPQSLEAPIVAIEPDVIISSAAYTAVDKAESEAELAEAVNVKGPGELARIANQLDIPILHLSTDYVFDGEKSDPYVETDKTNPVGIYGKTKLEGELAIAKATPNHVILRTAWVYSPYGNNFVKTMLRLGETRESLDVVVDQRGCPTSALEIARGLVEVAKTVTRSDDLTLRGIFNLTGQGEATWAEFATVIFDEAHRRGRKLVHVNSISSTEYPTPAKRPKNSRLSGEKLFKTYSVRLAPWQTSLEECLDALIAQPDKKRFIKGKQL